jgi:hypothetical protein
MWADNSPYHWASFTQCEGSSLRDAFPQIPVVGAVPDFFERFFVQGLIAIGLLQLRRVSVVSNSTGFP